MLDILDNILEQLDSDFVWEQLIDFYKSLFYPQYVTTDISPPFPLPLHFSF